MNYCTFLCIMHKLSQFQISSNLFSPNSGDVFPQIVSFDITVYFGIIDFWQMYFHPIDSKNLIYCSQRNLDLQFAYILKEFSFTLLPVFSTRGFLADLLWTSSILTEFYFLFFQKGILILPHINIEEIYFSASDLTTQLQPENLFKEDVLIICINPVTYRTHQLSEEPSLRTRNAPNLRLTSLGESDTLKAFF